MKVGLIGLPGVGKTTLSNAPPRQNAALHAYGVVKDEVNRGTVAVPDPHFDCAVEVCRPKKVHPATVDITDGGARVQVEESGAKKEKFGTDFFAGVRTMDALVLVLRAFHSPTLPDPPSGVDPRRDAEK